MRMPKGQRQRPVSAHGMAADRPCLRRREFRVDQTDQFPDDIGLHAEMRGPRRLRRIDIEARALPQIIGRIIGHPSPRGEVSGATMITPCSAAAAKAPALVVKLSSVQVRPDSQISTGNGPSPGGVNIDRVMGVPVVALSWRR